MARNTIQYVVKPSFAECHFLLMINPVNESEVEGVKIAL